MSLVEVVLSMFLLAGIMLVIVNLFHASLHYQVQVENRGKMAMLANRTMNDARAFAQSPANFGTGLSFYNGRTWTEPDQPEFTIRTDCVTMGRRCSIPCGPLRSICVRPWASRFPSARIRCRCAPLGLKGAFAAKSCHRSR